MNESVADLARRLESEGGYCGELRRRAARASATVSFAETEDPRVLHAAVVLSELDLLRPILLGDSEELRKRLADAGGSTEKCELVDVSNDPRAGEIAERLYRRRKDRGLTREAAAELLAQPLQFAAGLVGIGAAASCVAGAVHSTADVIRAGLHHVGLAEGVRVISGAFLMIPPQNSSLPGPLYFADAAVLPEPDEDQLVDVGRASAHNFERLTGDVARIACLSFSTKGSAEHSSAERMATVARRLADAGYLADGELQLDAALFHAVAQRKTSGSPVAGSANVLIFPDLGAGNIGYKLAERLGGYRALGPILQGFERPVYDLSRGCSAEDIVNISCIAALETDGAESK